MFVRPRLWAERPPLNGHLLPIDCSGVQFFFRDMSDDVSILIGNEKHQTDEPVLQALHQIELGTHALNLRNDNVLYHSLSGLASPLVQYVDFGDQPFENSSQVCRASG
jgi:hypothetical protein